MTFTEYELAEDLKALIIRNPAVRIDEDLKLEILKMNPNVVLRVEKEIKNGIVILSAKPVKDEDLII